MNKLRVYAIIGGLIGIFVFIAWLQKPSGDTYIFHGISGPRDVSVIAPQKDADWTTYGSDADSALAILLTDTNSNWLGLAHGLNAAGIPFVITMDAAKAVQHKVVMAYPAISGKINAPTLQTLTNFVHGGGTLMAFNVLGGGMNALFGFDKAVPLHARYKLKFTSPPSDADDYEKVIPIDNPKASSADVMGAYTYTEPVEAPLAVYEDNSPAIITHKAGSGRAIAFAFDLGALILKGYNNRQENMARSYDNGYEPALDVLLRFIANIYRNADERAVLLEPVPDGKKLAVILTHDIDYTRSLANALDYAKYEHDQGITATYFMQTKYIRDYNDDIILGPGSPDYLKQLHDLGMEIGSHTVSHSHEFRHFPMGSGNETYPDYHPFVENRDSYTGGTIFGELRVSRFLIEKLTPGVHVESFRPGYLSDPYGLPQALVATNYRFSSSVTANDSLTHLPFQLTYSRENTGESPIFEFPITIADGPPLLTDRLPEGVDLAKKIARHGGLCVVLIHPDVVEPKLGFEKQFVSGVKDFSWFGTIGEFGNWWAARNAVKIESRWQDANLVIHIYAPLPIDGLTLAMPAGFYPLPHQPLITEVNGQSLILAGLQGGADVVLKRPVNVSGETEKRGHVIQASTPVGIQLH